MAKKRKKAAKRPSAVPRNGEQSVTPPAVRHYTVVILPEALRQLQALPTAIRENIAHRIDGLAQESRPQMARPLKGERGAWRLRVGDYRVLYRIDDSRLLVTVAT